MSHSANDLSSRPIYRWLLAAFLIAILVADSSPLHAGSTRSNNTTLREHFMPQGEGAGTANGDYITADTGGLNTVYHYYIEAPPSLSRLVVDLFDADIGLGGTGEDDAGRDRQRELTSGNGWNTTATYTLTNPAGATRTTQFTTGNSTLPVGSDNAWLTLFDSTGDNFRDNFGTVAYTNNDGLLTWGTNWTETNDDGAANAGLILITGGELRITDNGAGGASTIERQANLSGAGFTTATLSFNARTTGVEASDVMLVQVSPDGGTNWFLLDTFTGTQASASHSYDITSRIATNTRIRFIRSANYQDSANDFFFVDNLQIQETNIDAGHWDLTVDMSSGAASDDDINALGIRAHDGNSGSTGTELNVYYDSHSQYGVNPAPGSNTRSYTLYPYITSGCSAVESDFDFDSNATNGNVGSLAFNSRTGASGGTSVFTQNVAAAGLSDNNVWDGNTITGWTADSDAIEYGVWSLGLTINTYQPFGTVNGNYSNLWMSNYLTSAPNTPTANPSTNAFRVYLPTDAFAAPLEPYLEQQVRFSGCGLSGPNPPVVGQTSCFTVTLRFVNPTPQTIRFSNSSPTNLVTARIPGGAVLYAGSSSTQLSHGSIVSQPSPGGSGDITWNPGSGSPTVLAANTTAILSYRVNVTPVSGARIPVTGTPASNGTTARYVDKTGNTTQTRATYTFGPLCELAVTPASLTPAVVSAFRASPADGGGVLVEWQTAAETGTSGFYLYRRDKASRRWVPVNKELLAGLQHADQGGTYRFVDSGASPYEPQIYRIEEVEAGGQRRSHGPFAVAVDWNRKDPRKGDGVYERDAHAATRLPAAEVRAGAKIEAATSALRIGADGAHLSVRETGVYYLSAAEVGAWLGMATDKAAKLIADKKLTLSHGGQEVAYYPDLPPPGSQSKEKEKGARGLFFYGEKATGIYTDAGVYRLQHDGRGLFMQETAAGAGAVGGGSFPETLHAEQDAFPATVISPDPESDYWFWDFLQGDDANYGHRTFTLNAPGLAGTGGSLAISLQGATASGITDEHQATVALNGQTLGDLHWTGITGAQASFPIGAGVLQESGNQVEITAHTGAGAPYSIYYVDGFDLSYPRAFRAVSDALAFTSGGNPQVAVGGFSASGVKLLDVADPLHPRWITGAAVGPDSPSGYRVTFAPSAAGRYLAAAPAAFKSPAAVRAWSAPALRSTGNRADYVVVVPAEMRTAGERLANLRRVQGLETMVVDLDQIMDEFNAGASSPHAIRDFLSYAFSHWNRPPRYVALAGEGTLDYRNLLGFSENLVSPLMVQSQGGLFPSDNRLGDVDGDGQPEMAVGRIPVLSAAELDAYTNKIAAYESASGAAWTAKAVLLADATDHGTDFSVDSDRVAGQISSPYTLDRIYLSTLSLADARTQLLGAIGSGASFINYMGHGALDRLSASGLLTNADVPGLANGERLPVLTAMTCTVNRFAVPGAQALGELLVKSATGGAAAVWGPSGLSVNAEARLLAERFYHATEPRLGDRVLRAIAEFRALGSDPSLPQIYDVLGDPALRLPVPPVTPGGGASTGE